MPIIVIDDIVFRNMIIFQSLGYLATKSYKNMRLSDNCSNCVK
jgi:hypothetical protein